jgi:quinol monooxygenase YgiN
VSGPIVFISHNRIKDGKLDGFRTFFHEGSRSMGQDKPGTVVFLAYVDDDGQNVDIVHVFPDAEAMDRHMDGVAERVGASDEFIQGTGVEIYGSPSRPGLEMMQAFATPQAPLTVRPDLVGGYLRPDGG